MTRWAAVKAAFLLGSNEKESKSLGESDRQAGE